MATQTGEKKWYTGSCHCGATRYEIKLDASNLELTKCNCSICHKRGYVLLKVPTLEDIKLISPASLQELGDYTFGTCLVHHRFCKTCAVSCLAEAKIGGEEMYTVNALSIDQDQGIELKDVKIGYVNGKAIGSLYKFEKLGPRDEPHQGGCW
ncbi:uncharacterized protein GIQ15_02237 [Arthroderma uncinatum]|uniref:uncharacterized protein n=1 Tax=Arthroderma uncinatum TaxID=74035 RepID=UPI00144AEF36|nr:uncharacterized protein GIQ15_02237 [Arthroderma uncinatum]KAF3482913.1 hypothetical protein GIQ15_02237 [Arthroderma uncinatum]